LWPAGAGEINHLAGGRRFDAGQYLDGVLAIAKAGEAIRKFLNE
jgi:hypothetical protein